MVAISVPIWAEAHDIQGQEPRAPLERPSPKSGVRPLAAKTLAKARRRLQQYVYPCIGNRPIGLVSVPELFAVLKKVQDGEVLNL
jgi:hypothetical protein